MKRLLLNILLILLINLVTLSMYADAVLAVVWKERGLVAYFAVADAPVICINENVVTISDTLNYENRINLSIDDLKCFQLMDIDLTPVEDVESPKPDMFRLTENGIEITGIQPGEMVWIYDITGRLIQNAEVNFQGDASIALMRGVYIVNVQGISFKIIKK